MIPVRHHSSILTLAITFFIGLVVMPLVVFPFIPKFATASVEYGDLLRNMQILSGMLTLLYVVLRRSEGDFRALFILALALFAGSESIGGVERYYGLSSLHPLEMLFTFALFIYGTLAFFAAIAEQRRGDPFHYALTTAVVGFVVIAGARIFFERKGALYDDRSRNFTFFVMIFLALQVAVIVIWGEVKSRREKLPPDAGMQ